MVRLTSILLMVLSLLAFWAASRVHRGLQADRLRSGPVVASRGGQSTPMVVFTTVALGGFRTLVADALWLRAVRLQDEGQYLELVPLADWITKLEPHLSSVWCYQAWNLTYNVSSLFPDPSDRWYWVKEGIRLLRDEGLTCNPNDPVLYHEIAWFYEHKIGYVMDTAHLYYKVSLAQEMGTLFDGPRPDYRHADREPRADRMRREYQLLPDLMETIDTAYGPLDWRLPDTHAVYWAWRGYQLAPKTQAGRDCMRILVQSLAGSFNHGRVLVEPGDGGLITTPDLDLLPQVQKAYEQAIERFPDSQFQGAYANFLGEAIMILYIYNRSQQAQALFNRLEHVRPGPETQAGYAPFVQQMLMGGVTNASWEHAAGMVEGFLFQSYVWYAVGESDRSAAMERLGNTIWKHYMDSRVSEEHRVRTGLPPLADLRRQAYQRALALPRSHLVERLKAINPDKAEDSPETPRP